MKCPVDKSDMIVVEHRKIELDYCLQCNGVWFDCGELDLFLEAAGQAANPYCQVTAAQDKARSAEASRKCPVCGHKMDKVWMGDSQKILVDSCPLGDGLWFDGGELHQILKQSHPELTGSEDLFSFLGDAFQADQQ